MFVETREARFHLSLAVLTISIIVTIIGMVDALLTSTATVYGLSAKLILNALAALVVAPIAYKALTKGLLWAMKRSIWVKKRILGRFYVEGTWAGYYYASEDDFEKGNVFYVIDHFRQGLSYLKVEGESFTGKGGARATWDSRAADISSDAARMVFVVNCDIPSKGLKCDAVTDFHLVRTDSDYPTCINGHSTNVTVDKAESTSLTVRQKKVSNKIIDSGQAIRQAHELYREDKNRFALKNHAADAAVSPPIV